MAKLNLMQLMELPVSEDFAIVSPDIESQLEEGISPDALSVYETAMEIKPEIKEAELNVERTILDEQVAKADKWPTLSMRAGVNTGWNSNTNGFNFVSQLNNKFSPSLGFNMSIPIFQKNSVKTNIKLAQISLNRAKLDETGVKNSLRKKVEQAVIDVETARISYEASQEQYQAVNETYLVAAEKFEIGLYSSIEFLVVKNDLITSESNLLKTKYNLVFSKKVLDFYQGIPISLTN
jgi:outer membrane protein